MEQPEILLEEARELRKMINDLNTYIPPRTKPKQQPIYQKGSKRKRK
jgi:hypothetical protein